MNFSTLADSNGNSTQLSGIGSDAGQIAKKALSVTAGIAAGNAVYGYASKKMGSNKGKMGIVKKAGAALLAVFTGLAADRIGSNILKTNQQV